MFGAGAGELTPLLIGEFRRALPEIELEFHELSMTDQFDQLRSGRVDVAILHPLYDNDDIDLSVLFEEPRCAAVPIHHEMADAYTLSVSDLAAEPFVTARAGTPVSWRQFWSLGEAGDSTHPNRAEMNSVNEGLAAVAFLNVVDTMPLTATRYHQHPGVKFVPLADASFSSVASARRRGDSRPAVEAFLELASRLSESHYGVVPGAGRPS
ncbi:LysR family substrate-binding domain-containing protein [Homoserinimonas sp. A447]